MYTLKRPYDIRNIDLQTEENNFFAVIKSRGEYIKYIDKPSRNLIKLALRINGMNVRFISDENLDRELCEIAAINGAKENILPIVDEDIKIIIDIVSEIEKNPSGQRLRGRTAKIFEINNEKTNVNKRFSTSLISDMPEFVKFYANNGNKIQRTMNGPIIVEKGKVSNFNSEFNFSKYKNFIYPDKSACYQDGVFNEKATMLYLENCPEYILEIDKKDLTSELIDKACLSGFNIIEALNTFKGFEKSIINLLTNRYYELEGKYCIEDIIKYYNDNIFNVDFLKLIKKVGVHKIFEKYNKEIMDNLNIFFDNWDQMCRCLTIYKQFITPLITKKLLLDNYRNFPILFAYINPNVEKELIKDKNFLPLKKFLELYKYNNDYLWLNNFEWPDIKSYPKEWQLIIFKNLKNYNRAFSTRSFLTEKENDLKKLGLIE